MTVTCVPCVSRSCIVSPRTRPPTDVSATRKPLLSTSRPHGADVASLSRWQAAHAAAAAVASLSQLRRASSRRRLGISVIGYDVSKTSPHPIWSRPLK